MREGGETVTESSYLGDGLYASYDGQIRLFTERLNGVHEVFLDDRTLDNFLHFLSGVGLLGSFQEKLKEEVSESDKDRL